MIARLCSCEDVGLAANVSLQQGGWKNVLGCSKDPTPARKVTSLAATRNFKTARSLESSWLQHLKFLGCSKDLTPWLHCLHLLTWLDDVGQEAVVHVGSSAHEKHMTITWVKSATGVNFFFFFSARWVWCSHSERRDRQRSVTRRLWKKASPRI